MQNNENAVKTEYRKYLASLLLWQYLQYIQFVLSYLPLLHFYKAPNAK